MALRSLGRERSPYALVSRGCPPHDSATAAKTAVRAHDIATKRQNFG
jgi:hypothetical protein